MSSERSSWWDALHPPQDTWIEGRLGHLVLQLYRHGNEWQLRHTHAAERLDEGSWREGLSEAIPESSLPSRFLFREDTDDLCLQPALADRPVIAKPRSQVTVPGRNAATVYVGTPVWVQLRDEHDSELLAEFSTERLSRTWFGPSPTSGEICYATATAARLSLDDLPSLPDYALTTVHLRNRSSLALRFSHIKLPVASLGIYRTENGLHVTEPVTMIQTDDQLTEVEIEPEGPHTSLPQVGRPRQPMQSRSLIQATLQLSTETVERLWLGWD